ncbi:FxLYD domain-containing protein [Streptomyces sp. NPDC053493]|uniref:FxLYD domain-containing protein n=1 Tax=Streptomyces sp. NPDC053493 TaxID=3365705 RepID=UPI0037D42386
MTRHRIPDRPRARARTAGAAVALLAALALTATGCEEAQQKAGDILSSATAEAAEQMNRIKDGVDAKDEVKAGPAGQDGDRTVAEITATNPKDKTADYTVRVDFRDAGGNLLDTVVLNIDDVPPGQSRTGRARSNRSLGGDTTAGVAQALRH